MSTIMLGVLRMPPGCWGSGPIDVAQRHAIYCEAADEIEKLRVYADCQRREIKRLRAVVDQATMSDLTAELRGKCDWCEPCQACRELMVRAADEIERLREEIRCARPASVPCPSEQAEPGARS